MASLGRIELPTYRLGGDYSILLSYKDTPKLYHNKIKSGIFSTYLCIIEKLIKNKNAAPIVKGTLYFVHS